MAASTQPPPLQDHPPVTRGTISLFHADPELAAGIPFEDRGLAARALTRPLYKIPAGRWAPGLLRGHPGNGFALLVIKGIVTRQLDFPDRSFMQILGRGDVLKPSESGEVFDPPLQWNAFEPTELVVLDDRFRRATQRWPSLSANLCARLLDQADRATLQAAIMSLPRVERRVLAILWQLAERWGRMTTAGVELPLKLTHGTLGRLSGAERPTVTLALRDLSRDGLLSRMDGGGWLLHSAPPEAAVATPGAVAGSLN